MNTDFTLFRFGHEMANDIVYLEMYSDAAYLDKPPETVRRYAELFGRLQGVGGVETLGGGRGGAVGRGGDREELTAMTAPRVGDWATVPFRKSTRSSTNGGQCVEVGARPDVIGVRDSKSPGAGLIELPASAWTGFLSALRAEA